MDESMKAIVFIGSNQFGTSREALTIAKELGYIVILFTDKEKNVFPEVDHSIYLNDLFDENKVLDEMKALKDKKNEICACVSFVDPFVSYAGILAKHLGLVEISVDPLYMMENKIRCREKLKDLPSSPYFDVFNHDIPLYQLDWKLPVILKTPKSNGSKDVFFVHTQETFKDGIKTLRKKYPALPVLIEEYLSGPQFLVEIIVYNNLITIVGVIEQEIMNNNGRFIVIGYEYPAVLSDEEYNALFESIEKIVIELGISTGSCHMEMRYVNGQWKLIEINPRMSGGAMNRIIEEGSGINLVKEILKMHLGEHPSLIELRKQHVYAKYLTGRLKFQSPIHLP